MDINPTEYLEKFKEKKQTREVWDICKRISACLVKEKRTTLALCGMTKDWSMADLLYSMDIAERRGEIEWWKYRKGRIKKL